MKKTIFVSLIAILIAAIVIPTFAYMETTAINQADDDTMWLDSMTAESTNVDIHYGTAPDGTAINIGDNQKFDHGISMHPPMEGPAEAEFNIEGLGYRTFIALGGKDLYSAAAVGVEGITGTHVGLEVWVDGVKKAESGNIPYPETYLFKVDITGAKKLKLVVTDGGDTIYCDTTSFAGARLFKQPIDELTDDVDPKPILPATPDPALKDKDKVYISDLPWVDYATYTSNDEMPEHRDENNGGEKISICGKNYEKGVCLHARPNDESYLEVNIEGLGFTTFAAYVGMAESEANDVTMGTCAFVVYADGVEKLRTDVMKAEDEAKLIKVDITDCKILRLAITNGGDTISGDWGTFASALIGRTDNTEELFGTPVPSQTPGSTASTSEPTSSVGPTPPTGEVSFVFVVAAAGIVFTALVFTILIKKKINV